MGVSRPTGVGNVRRTGLRVRRWTALAAIAGVVFGGVAGQSTAAVAAVRGSSHGSPPTASSPPTATDFGTGASTSSDLAVNAFGDGQGYHIQVAREASGFAWHQIAVLQPAGVDDESWTGYQCTSGDGRYEAVAVLPASAVNTTAARDHGAFAYSVNLSTGQVRTIASGVGLAYFSPGCGTGDEAEFTLNLGSDESTTEIVSADLATGKVDHSTTVDRQLTSPVPTASGVVAVLGSQLVSVPQSGTSAGKPTAIASVAGEAYDLRPDADGGVDFLALKPGASSAQLEHERGGRISVLGSGATSKLQLFQGRGGHNTVIGAGRIASGSNLHALATGSLADPSYTSLQGDAVFGDKQTTTTQDPTVLSTRTGKLLRQVPDSITRTPTDTAVSPLVPAGVTAQVSQPNAVVSLPAPTSSAAKTSAAQTSSTKASAVQASAVQPGTVQPETAQTPACSVPRDDPQFQALQPNNAQVDWAVQMSEQNLLTGSSLTRPANYQNMGLVAYSPNSDFAEIPLDHPSSDSWNTVPRSVYEAILAQESNWDQASWHALPGINGNPITADYYGAAGTIDTIDYAAADCGYGIGQVTTGMFADQTGQEYSAHGQEKIAVDYAENISAGLQILENTWNQLYTAGITANGGDPRYLENWYFAIWAYNTGIEPNAAHGNTTGCTPGPSCTGPDGTWGLGWANNPANPQFPPNRQPYLAYTYADAAHPGDWPYQERVLGWMGTPLVRSDAHAYAGATYNGGNDWLTPAPFTDFCTTAGDDCTPGTNTGTCTLSDSDCWWHSPVTWMPDVTTDGSTSSYTVGAGSTEPATSDPHPPVCSLDTSQVPTTPQGSPIIVPAQVGLAAGATPVDDAGCGASNWSNGGTFTYTYGTNANGDPIGQIDTHQLGVGFGGYIMFTHTEDGSEPSVVNTGTWTPTLSKAQNYTVMVHIPATGATTGDADYTITPGDGTGPYSVGLNQHLDVDAWVPLGTFWMTEGGNVSLSNLSSMTPGDYDVGYDAVAFVPQGGTEGSPLGGPPNVPDDPAGTNPAEPDCTCAEDTAGDPVSTATGYFGDSYTDLSTPGRGMPLDFTRTYASGVADPNGPNKTLAVNGPFGWGWTDSYNLSAVTDATSGDVTINQEDGSQVTFDDASGTYSTTAPRFVATLTKSGSHYVYTREGKSVFTFDTATGHLLSESDLAGAQASPAYATTMAYNSSGQLSTITDPAGRSYTLGWTSGHITSLTDSAGREVSYGYDSSGDLTDVYGVGTTRTPSLQNNDHTQYAYNTTTHLLTSVRQPKYYGDTTTSPSPVMSMTYDSSERVLTQTDQDGRTTRFSYGPSSSPSLTSGQTLVTDPAGHEVLDTYTNGLLTSQTAGYGSSTPSTTGYTYDPVSLGVTSITDPRGNKETFSYNTQGEKTSSSNQLGQTTSYTYDALGDLASTTDPLGVKTSTGYDQAGHIATASGTNSGALVYGLPTSQTVQQMDESADIVDSNPASLPSRTVNYYYDDDAHPADLTRTVDADGNTVTATYDADGDLATSTDADGDKTAYGYDTATGQPTSQVDPDGTAAGTAPGCTPPAKGCTTYGYDAFGNLTTTTDANGNKVTAVFDANGNKVSSTDGDGQKTAYTYDPANQQTSSTEPDGTTVSRIDFTPDGSVADTVDGTGAKTSYTYDSQNRKISSTDPDNRETTYGYDADGDLTTVTTSSGTTTYTFDKAGRTTGVSYSDGKTPSVTLTYDADGQRISMTDGTGTTSWSYDAFGEPVAETDGAGETVGYGYDNDGNATSVVYPGGTAQTVTQTFDKADRLSAVTDWNSQKSTFSYDPDGALTGTVYPNGDTVTNSVDNAGNQSGTTLSGAATASLGYARDKADQVTGVTPTTALPGSAQTEAYTADQQLKSSTSGSTATAYAYNAAGDPTTAAGNAQAFDAAGQLCWTLPGTATSGSPCTTAPTGATTYTYDAQGDRTAATPATGTDTTYGYNQADQLTGYTGPGGSASYAYNGAGLRADKTVGTTTTSFTWSTGATPDLLSDGTTDYIYGPDGSPVEQVSGSTSQWYLTDDQGSTRALLSSTGAIAGAYGYDAYGNPVHTGTATTPLEYGGGYLDAESGLLYLRARYYDPATEQFLTVDPLVAQTRSAYDYAADTPFDAADPTGASLWGDFESAAEAAAPFVADAVVDTTLEVATDGAATPFLAEVDEGLDAGIEGVEASDEAASDTAAADEGGGDDSSADDSEDCDEAPISMDEAVARGADHVDGTGRVVVSGSGGWQFINTTVDEEGNTVTSISRFDINPDSPHVQQYGPHLNLETQINGKTITSGPLADPHTPIDPTTIREGDIP